MNAEQLLRQADNADRHADQTADEEMKATLRKAAQSYRAEAAKLSQQGGDSRSGPRAD